MKAWLIAPTATFPENVSAAVSSSLHAEKHIYIPDLSDWVALGREGTDTNNVGWICRASISCPSRDMTNTPQAAVRGVLEWRFKDRVWRVRKGVDARYMEDLEREVVH